MSDEECVNLTSDLVLGVMGVGSFILISAVKNYIARKERAKMDGVIINYDCWLSADELIDLSIKDLTEQGIIINNGRTIQRPCKTRNINHRKQ